MTVAVIIVAAIIIAVMVIYNMVLKEHLKACRNCRSRAMREEYSAKKKLEKLQVAIYEMEQKSEWAAEMERIRASYLAIRKEEFERLDRIIEGK